MDDVSIERMRTETATARGYLPAIEAIFFETAARPYPHGPEREAFRERWLGRFLSDPQDVLILAITARQEVAGYLVGTLENAAESGRFRDMPHFREQFAEACLQFPAHLHINLSARFRGNGIGGRMIDAFADVVRNAGLPGLHVTTGQGMRNVRFYLAHGFCEIAQWKRDQGTMLFLGRRV